MAFQIGLYGRNLIPSCTWSGTGYESSIRDQNPSVLVQNHCDSHGMNRYIPGRCCCNYTIHDYSRIKHICRCLIRNYMSAQSYQRNALLGLDDDRDSVTDGRDRLADGKKKSAGYGEGGTGARYRKGALGQAGALSVHRMGRKQRRSSAKDDGGRSGKTGRDGYSKGGDGKGRDGKGRDRKGRDGEGGDGKRGDGKGRDGEGGDGKGRNGKGRDSKRGNGKNGDGKDGDGKSKGKRGQDNKSGARKDKDGRKGKSGKGKGEEEDEDGKAGGDKSKSDKSGQRKSGMDKDASKWGEKDGRKDDKNGKGYGKLSQKATRWGSKYGMGKLSCREGNIVDYLRVKMLEKDRCRCLPVCQQSPPVCSYPSNMRCCTPCYSTSCNAACLSPASYAYCQAPMQVCVGMPCY